MGEFCLRGYNAAMPEIDKGDDVFVVNDQTGSMWRLQVKTSLGSKKPNSRYYTFRIRENAIQNPQTPDLHFAFTMRWDEQWYFLLMDRAVLRTYVRNNNMGTPAGDYRQFTFVYGNDDTLVCSGVDISNHMNDWATWPTL